MSAAVVVDCYLTYGSRGDLIHYGSGACPRAEGQSGGAFFTQDEAQAAVDTGAAAWCVSCTEELRHCGPNACGRRASACTCFRDELVRQLTANSAQIGPRAQAALRGTS